MGQAISKLTIKGYKSIRNLKNFELRNLNILIGPNGSGKSNFIDFFRFLHAMMDGNLSVYVKTNGGCDGYLFNGPKYTKRIEASMQFEKLYGYAFSLLPTVNENFIIENEELDGVCTFLGGSESNLIEFKNDKSNIEHSEVERLYELITNFTVYHFHDTSSTAKMRRSEITADNNRLRSDASNIAPVLLKLKSDKPKEYDRIVKTIKFAASFFDKFILEPITIGEEEIVRLSWNQKGSDYPMQPYHFSDGTLRFICLATALLQPNPPSTILLDEPELGLHPFVLSLLAEMIKKASLKTQVIVATQSASLLSHFEAQDIIVVEQKDEESVFRRLPLEKLKQWIDDYSLGELWEMNLLEGRPKNE